MEIPLSRFHNISSDQFQTNFTTPSFLHSKIYHYNFPSTHKKRKTPLSIITSSYSLKPRPKLNPSQNFDIPTPPSKQPNLTSNLCKEIENLVLYRRYADALEMFEILECEGACDVSEVTYDCLVKVCIELRSIRGVKKVYNHMVRNGFEFDLFMGNRVLLMHVKCGMMIDARQLFDEMPERNLVSWNVVIGGMVDEGSYEEAFGLFVGMWREFEFEFEFWDGWVRTFGVMIRASAGAGFLEEGRLLHGCVVKLGLDGDAFLSCALINMYSKCGRIEDARCVFDGMSGRNVVAWNSIIAGYAMLGFSEEALSLYYEMQRSGVKMDNYTYSIFISICARLASLEHAKQAHAGLVRHGYGWDVEANTALVDFYGKWGRIGDARRVFDKMPRKNVMTWNALIAGYSNHGRGIEAVKLFDRMLREGMAPNHVTFLAVLSACAHSGLSDIGWEIFDCMSRDHKIKPRAMHYACMIELLGKEGLLDEAFALVRDAPFKPTENMWAALLTACRVHQNLELGKVAAERLYGMEPVKLSNYVVLLNIYYSSGKVEEAAGVKQTLGRRGLRMLRACSWIEVKKQPHCFRSGDKSHVHSKEIYERLDGLVQEIAKHGYVPADKALLPDVDKDEEQVMLYHSEKLAVAYGLISTSKATPLQVMQSHRTCTDCHNVIKLIAMVTGREIVVRDASRFHHFRDGICSCGDYW